ncbi:exodeoxyribonuclease III [Caedimonas varicaedens]|jgi:exodeoxyribonuclease-3|uniref:Exodeoxyribonuclease III n=1 Tax=Caedimonas varicaedens TaxID=1629334 RepID=A0A0K8MCQ9_9PROT|nr:exodeoxyribonuclease III [Caedimonas varicaedens]
METKIATWNVNSIRVRLPHVLKWVAEAKPHILLLQEIKCEDHTFPREAFEDLGYNIALAGQKTYNGVAILSREPLEDILIGLPNNDEDTQARYIEAVCGKFRVASVYVPNGMEVGSDKYAYKLAFFRHLNAHLEQRLKWGESFIVAGDYNVAPYEIDGYNPVAFRQERILCSQKEREALRQILYSGYTDALRALHPLQEHLYTWWDYRAGSWQANQGFRIDHLLLTPQAADLLIQSEVDVLPRSAEKASDHAPVWAVFS